MTRRVLAALLSVVVSTGCASRGFEARWYIVPPPPDLEAADGQSAKRDATDANNEIKEEALDHACCAHLHLAIANFRDSPIVGEYVSIEGRKQKPTLPDGKLESGKIELFDLGLFCGRLPTGVEIRSGWFIGWQGARVSMRSIPAALPPEFGSRRCRERCRGGYEPPPACKFEKQSTTDHP